MFALVSSVMAIACILATPGRCESEPSVTPAADTASSPDPTGEAAVKTVEGKAAGELIPLLGHERTNVRHLAEDRLKKLLETDAALVESVCYHAYSHSPDPEIRMRVRSVLIEYAVHWSKSFLGIRLLSTKSPDAQGNLVRIYKISQIQPKSPAARNGLQLDDIIRSIDHIEMAGSNSAEVFSKYLATLQPGTKVTIRYERMGKAKEVAIPLGRRAVQADQEAPPPDPRKCFLDYLKTKTPARPTQP
jgi:C-terminal processing protease CtpA/Prc